MLKTDLRKSITISSSHDTKLFGLLHIPNCTQFLPPLVVCFHGFASHKYGSKQYLVHLSKLLSSLGIASLRIDFRGSGDSEGDLTQASLTDFISDALNTIDFSLNISEINTEKIGLFGSSLGGSLALLSLKKYLNQIQALALWAPVISGMLWFNDNLKKFEPSTANKKKLNPFNVSQIFQEEFLKMNTIPIIHSLRNNLKILHMHGELDDIVCINQQDLFIQAVQKQSNNLTIKRYKNASHSLGEFSTKSNVLNEVVTWFTKQLL